jgi:hypothetical protein
MRRSRVAGTRRRRRPASLWHLRVRVAAPALRLHVQIWLLGPNRLWRVFRHWRETGRISSNSAEPARRSRRGRTLTYILHHSAAPEKWWASSPLTQRGRLTAGRRRLLTVRRAQATNPSRSTSGASTGIVQLLSKRVFDQGCAACGRTDTVVSAGGQGLRRYAKTCRADFVSVRPREGLRPLSS